MLLLLPPPSLASLCLSFSLLIVAARADGVDPPTPWQLTVLGRFENEQQAPVTFHVNDLTLRQRFRDGSRHFNQTSRRCVPQPMIDLWLNPEHLPTRLRAMDADETVTLLKDKETIERELGELVLKVVRLECELDATLISDPGSKRTGSIFLPVQFLYPPYPQSSRHGLNLNAETEWTMYRSGEPAEWYSGESDDLLYAIRHNIRHSLGLGHAKYDRRTIMFPRNIYVFMMEVQPVDVDAVHALLCAPTAVIHKLIGDNGQ